eukprot:TRINITY_DN20098_c0_g1_i1.p1 TRINITY_DN20098_c0_g1~~TRINITY_DN20098_c0_g1_i1.p1  ORF type:complete len:351 (+),score=57.90 TRINITY_DN20098_c0_g1_i1:53-1054(+)
MLGLSLDVSGGGQEAQVPDLPDEGLGPEDVIDTDTVLGGGAGGKVTLCKNAVTGQLYAKKSVLYVDENKMKEIDSEVSALRRHQCDYLITFYGAYFDHQACSVHFVLEYMDVGSLQDVVAVNRAKEASIPADILSHLMKQALTGLQYIHHTLKAIHRDFKPGNLLLNNTGSVKVTDFGISRELESSANCAETYVGTLLFMAPEMIQTKSRSYTNKIDIWAAGITLIELTTNDHPFSKCAQGNFLDYFNSVTQELPSLDQGPSDLQNFVARCIQKNPSDRESCHQLLEHTWLTSHQATDAFMKEYLAWVQQVSTAIKSQDNSSWMQFDDLDAMA